MKCHGSMRRKGQCIRLPSLEISSNRILLVFYSWKAIDYACSSLKRTHTDTLIYHLMFSGGQESRHSLSNSSALALIQVLPDWSLIRSLTGDWSTCKCTRDVSRTHLLVVVVLKCLSSLHPSAGGCWHFQEATHSSFFVALAQQYGSVLLQSLHGHLFL